MKNNYFTINPSVSIAENMKNLVNQIFRKEISLDTLIGKPPNYSGLYINQIHFAFGRIPRVYSDSPESKDAHYLCLSLDLHKSKYSHKRKSIKIIEQKINTTYLRRTFENFKALKEENESDYLVKLNQTNELRKRISKIKERNNITSSEISLYLNATKPEFQLFFNHISEDAVDQLMTYYNNKIKRDP